MESILDENVPQINTSILKPSQPSKYVRTPKSSIKSGFKRFNDFGVKRPINNKFETFKKKVMSLYPKQFKFEKKQTISFERVRSSSQYQTTKRSKV